MSDITGAIYTNTSQIKIFNLLIYICFSSISSIIFKSISYQGCIVSQSCDKSYKTTFEAYQQQQTKGLHIPLSILHILLLCIDSKLIL